VAISADGTAPKTMRPGVELAALGPKARRRLKRELVSTKLRLVTKHVTAHHRAALARAYKGTLSPGRRRILAALIEGDPRSLTATVLAAMLRLNRSTIREHIERLKEHKMVTTRAARDRRNYVLTITREGRRAFHASELLDAQVQDAIVRGLGPKQTLLLLDLLDEVERVVVGPT